MGIIKHLTAAVAKGAVEYVAYNAIEVAAASADLVSKQIEKGEKKKQQKMVNGNPDGLRFIVQCTDDSKMCKYNVLNMKPRKAHYNSYRLHGKYFSWITEVILELIHAFYTTLVVRLFD